MRLSVLLIFVSLAFSGCQTAPVPMVNAFDPSYAAFASARGSGSIVGQAFLRQVGGNVVTAAGENVLLIPDQHYTRELVSRLQAGMSAPGEENPVRPFTQSTVADASGSFAFEGLAPGDYLVMTAVRWGAPSQYGMIAQGGVIARPVTVRSGITSRVIIN